MPKGAVWGDLIIVQPPPFNGLAGIVEIGKPVPIQGLTTVLPVEAPNAEALHGAPGGDTGEHCQLHQILSRRLLPGGAPGGGGSTPRSMTWCRTPVVDPGRRAGPKGPDEERKGIQPGTAGHGGTVVVGDLFDKDPQ